MRSEMFLRAAAIAAGLALAPSHTNSTEEAPLRAMYVAMLAEFSDRGITNDERYARLADRYRAASGVIGRAAAASDESLRTAFSMSEAMLVVELGYSRPSPRPYVDDMSAVFEELMRRDKVTVEHRDAMMGAHLSVWQLVEANALATGETKLKGDEIVAIKRPPAFDSSAPAFVDIAGADGIARVESFHHGKGPSVVISAGCHVARRAAEAISADPGLSAAFRRVDALWLSPAMATLNTGAIDEWNARFPEGRMRISFDNSSWHGVDFARLPSFHFYMDGRLVKKINGWNRDDGAAIEQIRSALESIGVDASPSLGTAPARD